MINSRNSSSKLTTVLLILPYMGLFFLVWKQNDHFMHANFVSISSSVGYDPTIAITHGEQASYSQTAHSSYYSSSSPNASHSYGWDLSNPLGIPKGEAPALPSIRVSHQESAADQRKYYGGAGDKPHLGGFTEFDSDGISPNAWKNMVTHYGIRSVLDIGCGRGISTTWFLYHGLRVKCAEGSHDAVEKTLLPDPATQVTEHDFSRGPWWPKDTYDAAWAVEFLEHVGVNYHFNYVSAFRKAAILFVTSSRWGGWHHVEVHFDPWWIRKYESYGFHYDPELTEQVRKWAREERHIGPHGKRYHAQHIFLSMKVFINPVVAALPQHAHLFPELGCFAKRENGTIVHRECGTGNQAKLESKLPESFRPLPLTAEMDQRWLAMLREKLNMTLLHR